MAVNITLTSNDSGSCGFRESINVDNFNNYERTNSNVSFQRNWIPLSIVLLPFDIYIMVKRCIFLYLKL